MPKQVSSVSALVRMLFASIALADGGGASFAQTPQQPQPTRPPAVSYFGFFRIHGSQATAAFSEFREFLMEGIAMSRFRGHVELHDGQKLPYASTSLFDDRRMQFTTERSAAGVSYSFLGELLKFPPEPSDQIPALEGTLRRHQHGVSKAVAKLRFTFHPLVKKVN
ncbi:hypothetical protein F183_A07350 [Bryobacterales bacterium F-183]|nr:hypothetical protein F183_A07350 [Bryobacterales bacterium F-183]